MHEYGHYIDSQIFGPSYLPVVALLSLISASGNGWGTSPEGHFIWAHNYYWTETRANRNASDYFGRFYGVDWKKDKYRGRTIIDEFPL